ncbi:MAG: antitoxin family protein [Nitrospiraceae bacterium]|nr:antitoxin family protein [Nitrospirota bacterium]MDA8337792.1 antitoxin family protein [Nitrospiraceae bacterium]
MPKTIEAIYENGVLKPTKKLKVPEHSRLRLIISSEKEWANELGALLKKVHKRTKQFSSEEIEKDITLASKERC